MNKVLVFLEQRNGQIKKSSFEVLAAAKKLVDTVDAVVAAGSVEAPEAAGKFGAASVTVLKSADFENYTASGYAKAVADFANDNGYDTLFFAHSAMGKDLAPRVAAKMDAGIAVDVVEFAKDGDDVIATRPVYAGKALLDVKLVSDKKVFTTRPNIFVAEEVGADATVNEVAIGSADLSVTVTELVKSEGKLDVAEADLIVSGGRGLKEAENFKMVEQLADTLGAAVGASRAVVDAGWRPHAEQVGQTGKTVSPNLYVAVGISGAIQHLAGMRSSKYIVAINKDKDAPIFQIADYGITGDAFEIVPELIKEIKKTKSE